MNIYIPPMKNGVVTNACLNTRNTLIIGMILKFKSIYTYVITKQEYF